MSIEAGIVETPTGRIITTKVPAWKHYVRMAGVFTCVSVGAALAQAGAPWWGPPSWIFTAGMLYPGRVHWHVKHEDLP